MGLLHRSQLGNERIRVFFEVFDKFVVFGLMFAELHIDSDSRVFLFMNVKDMLSDLMHLRHQDNSFNDLFHQVGDFNDSFGRTAYGHKFFLYSVY